MAKQRIIPIIYKVDFKQVDQSTAAVKKAEKATDALNKEIKETGDQGGKSFGRLKNAIIATGVVTLIGSLAKQIFNLGVANEQTAIAFNTLTGSMTRGRQLLKDLTKFSIETPFTPDQVNKAAKALLAFGVEAKKVIPTLKLLGDVSSGTGKDLAEMAVIFGQIRSTGRLMGQDLLQLINAGFNPLQQISMKTGKTMTALKFEMEKGLITFDMVEQSFRDATSEGGLFFDLMKKQSESLGGRLSTVQGNFEELGKAIFKLSTGPIPAIVDKFNIFLERVTEFLNKGDLANILEPGLKRFRDRFDEIDGLIQSSNKKLQEQGVELQNIFANDLRVAINETTEEISRLDDQEKRGLFSVEEAKIRREILNLEVQSYRDLLKETIVLRHREVAVSKQQTKEDKDRTEALKKFNEQLGFTTAAQKIKKKEENLAKEQKIEDDANERSRKNQDYYNEYKKRKEQETQEEIWRIKEESAERQRRIEEETFNRSVELAANLFSMLLTQRQIDTQDISDKYDRELELAGDNDRAKEQIEKDRDIKLRQAERRNKEIQKRNARTQIGIDTIIAIIKTFSQFGYPAGIVPAALMAGIGAVQLASVNRYAKGVIDLQGPGTGTSDSIPARLSKGESVMTAEETLQSKGILKAIRAKKLDDRLIEKLSKGSKIGSDGTVFSDAGIIAAIKGQKPDDVITKGSYVYDLKRSNNGSVRFIRRKYLH